MPSSNSFWRNVITGSRKKLGKIFSNRYKKVNISSFYLKFLKHVPPGAVHHHKLLGYDTWFFNGQEYLHAIGEIYMDEIYRQRLQKHSFIIDCGANIGLSVIYLKSICPTAKIVAFEPDRKNFEFLEKNTRSHRLENVELRNEAVWKEDTILRFESEGTMSSKIAHEGGTTNVVEVKAVRLKNFLTERVDFLKIDIEGAEFEVLVDIQDQLHLVENLFVEYHGSFRQNEELTALFAIFLKAGFHFYIKEATDVYRSPFFSARPASIQYDLQLNIFCFRKRNPQEA